jgi:hypothetical protein
MVKTNLLFEAGFAIGDIPLTHLYNTSQITLQRNHCSKNHLSGKIVLKRCTSTIFSPVSSCISNLNMASIGSLFSKKKPSLVLVSRMAWEIYKTEQHVGVDYKTLNEGYFESG